MGIENSHWIIFCYLLIMMFTSGSYASRGMIKEDSNKELKLVNNNGKQNSMNSMNDPTNVLKLHSMTGMDTNIHKHHAMSSMQMMMSHIDPSLMVFFLLQDLKIGNKIPIFFPKRKTTQFLPKEKADSIPFSSKQLPSLLKVFSFSQNSSQTKAMEDTLRQCEARPIKGETKLCATSYESMLGFTRGVFGLDVELVVLSTTHLTKTNEKSFLQNYTILEIPKKIETSKMVPCHTMPYPYVVFYCHYQVSESKVFKIVLEGEKNGEKVEGVAICHMDTSEWSPNHVSFSVLGIEPGSSPVCHFLPADNLVWIKIFSTME